MTELRFISFPPTSITSPPQVISSEMTLSGPYGDQHYDGEARAVVIAGGPGVGPAVAIAERAIDEDAEAAVVYRDDDAAHADRSVEDAPGLILLDLKLPKVSGHEVLRALKSDERTRHIPVVVLSSSGERSDVERCYALGANSYVVKPVDFDAFTNTVQRIGTYWLQMNETYGA